MSKPTNYRVESFLGGGGNGQVYAASDGHRDLAVKVLRDVSELSQLETEVRILSRLSHTRLIRIEEFFAEAPEWLGKRSGPCLLMERVSGKHFDVAAREMKFDAHDWLRVTTQLAEALHYLHSHQILHRDLKPANVLVTNDGDLKILDFGMANTAGERDGIRGTLGYLAPEALWGEYGAKSDLFAMGVLLYQAMTGRLPYADVLGSLRGQQPDPEPLAKLRPELPAYLRDTVHRLLAPDPERRFASAATVLRYLALQSGTPSAASAAVDHRPPLTGREAELAAVSAWLESAGPRCLEILGPTGIGKTRFLEAVKWQVQLQGGRWLRIEAGDWPGWLGADTNQSTLQALEQRVADLDINSPVLLLADLQDWPEAALQQALILLSWLEASRSPVRVILERNEDFNFESLAPLDAWLESQVEARALRLAELADSDAVELLRAAAPELELTKPQIDAIQEASGGRPLLLLENLEQAALQGALAGDARNAGRGERLVAAARVKLVALTPAAQRLLALILVGGDRVESEIMERLWYQSSDAWQAAILQLRHAGVLRETASAGHFKLAQASLAPRFLAVLDGPILKEAHRAWLEYWQSELGEAAQAHPAAARIAEHAYHADASASAVQWAIATAPILESAGRYQEGIALFERILPLSSDDTELYPLEYARAHFLAQLGRYPEALAGYDRWIAVRPDDASGLQKAKHRLFYGMALLNAGEAAAAELRFEECLAIGGATPSHAPYQARALGFLGAIAAKRGALESARHYLERAQALADALPAIRGDIEQRRGELEQLALNDDDAFRYFQMARQSFQAANNPEAEPIELQYLAVLLRDVGRPQEALNLIDQAIAGTIRLNLPRLYTAALGNRALIRIDLGDFGTAWRELEQAKQLMAALGNDEQKLANRLHQAELLLKLGNRERFAAMLQELEGAGEALRAAGRWPEFLLLKAEAAYQQGDWPRAGEWFQRAAAEPSAIPAEKRAAELGLQRVALASGLAFDAVPSSLALLETSSGPSFAIWRNLLRATAGPVAVDELGALLQQIAAYPNPWQAAEWKHLLAYHLGRQNQKDAAGVLLRSAKSDFQKLLARLPEEFKMDFENHRKFDGLDGDLENLLGVSLGEPARTPAPSASPPTSLPEGTVISEQRFLQFSEITRQIATREDLKHILERVMDAAIELTGAERGFLLMKRPESAGSALPGYEIEVARRLNHAALEREEMKLSLSAVRDAMEQGSILITDNAQVDPRLSGRASVAALQLKSILVLPLEIEGRIMGAVYLDHRLQPGKFFEKDLIFLNAFTAQASIAIEKSRLIAELKQAKSQLETKVADLTDELCYVREQLRYGYEEIVGKSAPMMEVFRNLDHVTDTTIPVWIHGESGTGKELVARSLHYNSSRKNKPYVSENCSAIPENLLESELFGHKKGAFTHADRDRIGLFQQADGGTLFLDEVADMSTGMQVKLLRALQEGEIRQVGGNQSIPVDVRLVTASNKDLARAVQDGSFREDLYFRINGLTLRLPPLRERKEDLPLLINFLMEKIVRDFKLKPSDVSDDALEAMLDYRWPGNIRELESVLRNTLLFAKGRLLTPQLLALGGFNSAPAEPIEQIAGLRETQGEERRLMVEALRRTKMDKRAAAREMGISIRSFYMRMDRHKIPKNKAILKKFLDLDLAKKSRA